jgi:GNAT superfamily N-acetyltransferase
MTIDISSDRSRLDLEVIHGFLATCYWSPGIARERVARAIEHSLCWGAYDVRDGVSKQVGFARVVTDCATFAYLCDVFVLESHRGQRIATRMVQAAIDDARLQGIRRFCLFTRDAHHVYAGLGFGPTADPTRYMERLDREGYRRP